MFGILKLTRRVGAKLQDEFKRLIEERIRSLNAQSTAMIFFENSSLSRSLRAIYQRIAGAHANFVCWREE